MAQILVVDDEAIIAMTMGDWLADLGHTVVGPASDLAQALSLCDATLDAAVLDVSLGVGTTQPVAARLDELGVPYAVASGHDPASLDPAFAGGLALPKPFGFEMFRRTIERLLDRART